ncbi:MAG: hypothetical protein LBT33_00505, partial [Spirochaetia bacterium]|nr:hypothetical protein [Spirochaetia bacterium]
VNKLRKRCAPFWRSRAKNPGCMGEQYFCIRYADTKIRPARLSASIPRPLEGAAGFPLQSFAPHGLTYALTCGQWAGCRIRIGRGRTRESKPQTPRTLQRNLLLLSVLAVVKRILWVYPEKNAGGPLLFLKL